MYYLNKRFGIVSVPVKEKTIRLKPGKPELIEEGISEEFLKNACGLVADGTLVQIPDEEAKVYLQKWEEYKRIPAKEMQDNADKYLSASTSYARQEARQEGIDVDAKKKAFIPAW